MQIQQGALVRRWSIAARSAEQGWTASVESEALEREIPRREVTRRSEPTIRSRIGRRDRDRRATTGTWWFPVRRRRTSGLGQAAGGGSGGRKGPIARLMPLAIR